MNWWELIAAAGLTIFALRLLNVLERICKLLSEIRETLPDRHLMNDDGQPDIAEFWREVRYSMNRLARIYDKFVRGKTN